MTGSTEELLAERERTHGDFEVTAYVAYELKAAVSRGLERAKKEYIAPTGQIEVYQESLDMILSKVARIVAGDPNFAEHWRDIAGYAMLAAGKCSR